METNRDGDRYWTLIDRHTDPLGAPEPETIEIARLTEEGPPSGDAIGGSDPLLLPDGVLLLVNKRWHSPLPGRDFGRRYPTRGTHEVRRSKDSGRTWELLGPLDPDPDGVDMTASLVHPNGAATGFARVFVERRVNGEPPRLFTLCTHDAGERWGEKQIALECDLEAGVGFSHAFNGLKKLEDGTFLLPMQRRSDRVFLPPVLLVCRPTADPTTMGSQPDHWEIIEVGHDLPESDPGGPAAIISEPDVMVRPDGTWLLIMRSSCGWMFECESEDGGRTWSRLRRSAWGCTNSKHHLLRLRDGTVLMAHHDANNTQSYPTQKRSPLALSVSRDGGRTWERTVSAAWRSDWQYGYPKGIELPDGDLLYFSRYGENHDAQCVGITRVARAFLDGARISQNAEGGRLIDGVLHIERSDATFTSVDRRSLSYPVSSEIELTIDDLEGRFALLSLFGEGSMEVVTLGACGDGDSVRMEVLELDGERCCVDWRDLGVMVPKGQPVRARLSLRNPYRYELEIAGQNFEGLTLKPLRPYGARIGTNLTKQGPLRDAKIRARVTAWDLSSGTIPFTPSELWDSARPLYRFITPHFALDEHGPHHGRVPRIGVDLSLPQGQWGNGMDCRNPVLIEANVGGERDGVLEVEQHFLNWQGTLAFYGLPLLDPMERGALVDASCHQLGLVNLAGLRAYVSVGKSMAQSSPLSGGAGLYAWRWGRDGEKFEFLHVDVEGHLTDAGKVTVPSLPTAEGRARLFNSASGLSPFRGRVLSLGVWDRPLSNEELRALGRY